MKLTTESSQDLLFEIQDQGEKTYEIGVTGVIEKTIRAIQAAELIALPAADPGDLARLPVGDARQDQIGVGRGRADRNLAVS